MNTHQTGGKFIAKGSFGCVHYPHIQCVGMRNVPKTVGKVFFDDRDMQEELQTSLSVQKTIDPNNEFTIPLIAHCRIKALRNSDEFEKCVLPADRKTTLDYQQLLYPHAGVSVFHIITKDYKSQSTINKHFLKIFRALHNIIDGLIALNRHRYVHQDIKLDNIMMKNNKLFLIDFGIAQPENMIFHQSNLYGTLTADQVYYPPEFKAFTKKYKTYTDFHAWFLQSWKDDIELYDILQNIHASTYDTDMQKVFKMTKRHISEQAQKIDTFSLGIELLELLIICRVPKTISSRNKKMITFVELYIDLVRGMTRIDPKERWTVSQVKNKYNLIIEFLDK
jgi:serine/threonine protein kinase